MTVVLTRVQRRPVAGGGACRDSAAQRRRPGQAGSARSSGRPSRRSGASGDRERQQETAPPAPSEQAQSSRWRLQRAGDTDYPFYRLGSARQPHGHARGGGPPSGAGREVRASMTAGFRGDRANENRGSGMSGRLCEQANQLKRRMNFQETVET